MKTMISIFAFLSLLAFQASASQASLDLWNNLKTLGAPADAGAGSVFQSLETLNCSQKKATDCGTMTYECTASPDNSGNSTPLTATGDLAKALYATLQNATTGKPSCDSVTGDCTFYATDVQCRQANAENWDPPSSAPSEADRTDCHFSIQVQL